MDKYKYKYEEKAKEFYPVCEALNYSGIWGGEDKYEPVRYASKGYENETEMEFAESPRVPREDLYNHIAELDAAIPELGEEAYADGYA